eukprot:TRINITY_DN9113_c0_g1_i1.p1 TRINITY_DN9113_c0_g1~~TRINITY_DN9113_c0_g1_i1.p1  ORF type:complete len:160 (-),score=68.34 TRINITY_DN9113_c0_g1_i1:32-487(-)
MGVPGLLDHISVEVEGATFPLVSLGQISTKGPNMLVVLLHDPLYSGPAVKSIQDTFPDFGVAVEASQIRVSAPKATKESRQAMAKLVGKRAEEIKAQIRRIRQDALHALKKVTMSQDETKRFEKQIQKLTDDFSDQVASIASAKEKEIETA